MYKKIKVYVNGEYKFSTHKFPTCKACKDYIRAIKHLEIESIPTNEFLTVNDYDELRVEYAKE